MKRYKWLVVILFFCLILPITAEEDLQLFEVEKYQYVIEENASVQLAMKVLESEVDLKFESSQPDIASVDQTGLVSAIKPGKTEITITASYEGFSQKEIIELEVYQKAGKIHFKEKEFYLIRGLTYKIPFDIEGSVETNEIIWESTDPMVASVENGIVTGRDIGKTIIRAKLLDGVQEMVVHVTAPLKELAFNPEKILMTVGETRPMPGFIYVPYDTTSSRSVDLEVADHEIIELRDNQIHALKKGRTFIEAWGSNNTKAILDIEIKAKKTGFGADILSLSHEEVSPGHYQITHDSLENYQSDFFYFDLKNLEVEELFSSQKPVQLDLVLENSLLDNDMEKLQAVKLPSQFFEGLSREKALTITLKNQNDDQYAVYKFNSSFSHDIDLKHQLLEISDSFRQRNNIVGPGFYLKNNSLYGFPLDTEMFIPNNRLNGEKNRIYFRYELNDQDYIEDDFLSLRSDDQGLTLPLDSNEYIFTLSRVSKTSDRVLIFSMLMILSMIAVSVLVYFYKKR